MKTKIIGQIHDSILLNIDPTECNEVLAMAKRIMEIEIREVWKWIILPLEVEMEVAPIGATWQLKKEVTKLSCQCGMEWTYKQAIKNDYGDVTGFYQECPVCRKTKQLS